jgi:hypothetical protein
MVQLTYRGMQFPFSFRCRRWILWTAEAEEAVRRTIERGPVRFPDAALLNGQLSLSYHRV